MDAPIIKRFEMRVKRVYEQIEQIYMHGVGKDAVFKDQSNGWFVAFDYSYEALPFGPERPDLKEGDKVIVSFQKV